MLTLPSLADSSAIYVIGDFFHKRIAIAVADLAGAAVMFMALSSSWPADMKQAL